MLFYAFDELFLNAKTSPKVSNFIRQFLSVDNASSSEEEFLDAVEVQ